MSNYFWKSHSTRGSVAPHAMKVSPDNHDDLVLSTGKVVSANWQIIGLNVRNDLTEGFDGILEYEEDRTGDPDDALALLFTPAERVEIADWMIERWTEFRTRWLA